jgi:4-hydroxybenzoate polyprenyltransferase
MKYLKLIRYQNLLILAFMQLIFRYGFLKLQNIPLALTDWQYLLLVLSTVLIARLCHQQHFRSGYGFGE